MIASSVLSLSLPSRPFSFLFFSFLSTRLCCWWCCHLMAAAQKSDKTKQNRKEGHDKSKGEKRTVVHLLRHQRMLTLVDAISALHTHTHKREREREGEGGSTKVSLMRWCNTKFKKRRRLCVTMTTCGHIPALSYKVAFKLDDIHKVLLLISYQNVILKPHTERTKSWIKIEFIDTVF